MKPLALSLIAAAGALSLSACADSGYGGHYFGGGLAYDSYYDDAYGPYYGGYWGPDDVFMYRRDRRGPFVRDEAHHFRHDHPTGFHGVRSMRPPGGGRPSGSPDHRPG